MPEIAIAVSRKRTSCNKKRKVCTRNAYQLFMSAYLKANKNCGGSQVEKFKKGVDAWNNLDCSGKRKWMEASKCRNEKCVKKKRSTSCKSKCKSRSGSARSRSGNARSQSCSNRRRSVSAKSKSSGKTKSIVRRGRQAMCAISSTKKSTTGGKQRVVASSPIFLSKNLQRTADHPTPKKRRKISREVSQTYYVEATQQKSAAVAKCRSKREKSTSKPKSAKRSPAKTASKTRKGKSAKGVSRSRGQALERRRVLIAKRKKQIGA